MTLKVAVVELAETLIVDDGTGSSVLLLISETTVPPVGAALLIVTVQVALALEVRLVALQVNEETAIGAVKLMVTVLETVPKVAVRVAL